MHHRISPLPYKPNLPQKQKPCYAHLLSSPKGKSPAPPAASLYSGQSVRRPPRRRRRRTCARIAGKIARAPGGGAAGSYVGHFNNGCASARGAPGSEREIPIYSPPAGFNYSLAGRAFNDTRESVFALCRYRERRAQAAILIFSFCRARWALIYRRDGPARRHREKWGERERERES